MYPEMTPADLSTLDRSSPVRAAIAARRSTKRFSEQPPSRAQIEALLQAAVCAPDHGQLAPWRFAVLQGDARGLFADALADALRSRMPDVADDAVARGIHAPAQAWGPGPATLEGLTVAAVIEQVAAFLQAGGSGVAQRMIDLREGGFRYEVVARPALSAAADATEAAASVAAAVD